MTSEKTAFARHLRKSPTQPELILWHALRDRRLAGAKFRRQVPIGRYVVDFLCVSARLVVELDGRQHGWFEAYDEDRTRFLEAQGHAVLRFENAAVLQDIDAVLDAIRARVTGRLDL